MKKRLVGILAFVLVFSLCSMSAFAASSLEIEDGYYEEAANGEGSGGGTWAWDGAEDLQLNDFVSDYGISTEGSITITTTGDCTVGGYGIDVFTDYSGEEPEEGDLTITGDGTLNVVTEDDWDLDGIYATGDVEIKDTTVNVKVSVPEDYYNPEEATPYGIYADNITIDNSKVVIELEPEGVLAVANGDWSYGGGDMPLLADSGTRGPAKPTGTPGKITLKNDVIIEEGINIRDITWPDGSSGQIIAPGEGPVKLDDVNLDSYEAYRATMKELLASKVTIMPPESKAEAPSVKAAAVTGIPATGDASDAAMWITVMLIAGSFIVSAIARKRAH